MHQILEPLGRLIEKTIELFDASIHEISRRKSRGDLATLHDLHEMEKRMAANIEDLIAAATALSTVVDSGSLKLDNLIAKVDAFIALVPSSDLSPDGVKALAALKASRDIAVGGGDKMDAEVSKLDGVLPKPAPAGSPN